MPIKEISRSRQGGGSVSLYKKVAERLRSQVMQLDYGTKLPPERLLGEKFGTTRVTVRKAIKELIDQGVVYSEVGKGNFRASPEKARRSTALVGSMVSIILPDLSDIYLDTIRAISQILKPQGMIIAPHASGHNPIDIEKHLDMLGNQESLKGVIILPPLVIHDKQAIISKLQSFKKQGTHVVFANRDGREYGFDSVYFNDTVGMAIATEYLINNGNQHIGYVMPSNECHRNEERLAGYKRAMTVHGLEELQAVCFANEVDYGEFEFEGNIVDFVRKNKLSAIVAHSDYIAAKVLSEVLDAGFNVPKDIAIVGFDGLASYPVETPIPLTTTRRDRFALGLRSAYLLLSRMSGIIDNEEYIGNELFAILDVKESSCDASSKIPNRYVDELH